MKTTTTQPKIRKTPVQPYRLDLLCGDCGAVLERHVDYPRWYICPVCKTRLLKHLSEQAYPTVVFEPADPASNSAPLTFGALPYRYETDMEEETPNATFIKQECSCCGMPYAHNSSGVSFPTCYCARLFCAACGKCSSHCECSERAEPGIADDVNRLLIENMKAHYADLCRKLAQAQTLLLAAYNALRSYQHGNTSHDLAEEVADRIKKELER